MEYTGLVELEDKASVFATQDFTVLLNQESAEIFTEFEKYPIRYDAKLGVFIMEVDGLRIIATEIRVTARPVWARFLTIPLKN